MSYALMLYTYMQPLNTLFKMKISYQFMIKVCINLLPQFQYIVPISISGVKFLKLWPNILTNVYKKYSWGVLLDSSQCINS